MELRLIAFTGEANDGNKLVLNADGGGVRWEKSTALLLSFPSFCVHPPQLLDLIWRSSTQRCLWIIGGVFFPAVYDRRAVVCVCVSTHTSVCEPGASYSLQCKFQVSLCSDSPKPPVLNSSRFPRKKANSWGKRQWDGNCSSPWKPWETVEGKLNLRKVDICSLKNYQWSNLGHIIVHSLWKTFKHFLDLLQDTEGKLREWILPIPNMDDVTDHLPF